jgi:threonine/homoserine/homoserine lactone efflux protein
MPHELTLSLAVAAIATMVVVSIGWYFFVAYMFASEPVVRGYREIGHWVDKLAGGMLVLLGLKLAIESK